MDEGRPDAFLRMIKRSRRGRLKIYLGYAAGVGKTYQMLQEARRLLEDGIDVAVGFVEPHGRPDTIALVTGLEVVPRKVQEYRGVALEEMDLDALLARRPQVALVDELAHTNAPGSRNTKRFEDVEEILAAGIHVITTLNVQHLESLYEMVERAVKVRVRERLPDRVLLEADQIVNVDLTPEDLHRRLREGKVYPQERAQVALKHFFTTSNLQQLRELTLRETAAQIDARRREPGEEEMTAAPDQVMVCLSSRGPNSDSLLRYGSRLAGRLNRNWYAVYVQTPSEEPAVIDAETQRILSSTLTLAKQLGAIVFTYKGEDVAAALLQFAREYRVGHIILGTPRTLSLTRRALGEKSLVQRILGEAHGATVVVVDTRTAASVTSLGEARRPSDEKLLLNRLLTPERLLIWDAPVSRDTLIGELTRAACEGQELDQGTALAAVQAREAQGSTFLNEGAAFPHARVAGLPFSLGALGLTRRGVLGSVAPVRLAFLLLSPEEAPEEQLQFLAAASRIALDRNLIRRLDAARDSPEAYQVLLNWEGQETI